MFLYYNQKFVWRKLATTHVSCLSRYLTKHAESSPKVTNLYLSVQRIFPCGLSMVVSITGKTLTTFTLNYDRISLSHIFLEQHST